MKSIDIAVLGATGAVGETMLSILEERKFPINKLYPLASKRSAGKTIIFKNKAYYVEDVEQFDFSKVKIALFSAGSKAAAKYAPRAAKAGCVVIDNSSQFRREADIPLVVAEVNPHDIALYKNRHIIANPNCSVMQMLVALKPLHDVAHIERINVATYQSVSGTGRRAIEELAQQTANLLNGNAPVIEVYPQQIAFNVLPCIGEFLENGYSDEEDKMIYEAKKILGDESIQVNATTARVPVFHGHSEAVNIETRKKITAAEAKALLSKAPGVILIDNKKHPYPTPIKNAAGNDAVYVGRVREDVSHLRGLNLWIVADNLRKGAALNAIQIAELWLKNYAHH